MYMILTVNTPTVTPTAIKGVEFSIENPRELIKGVEDKCYINVGNSANVKVTNILNNISACSLGVKVSTLNVNDKVTTLAKVTVPTNPKPNRKLDPLSWNGTVKPAWYRVVATTDNGSL